jgi:azurin
MTMTRRHQLAAAGVLWLAAGAAYADPCKLTIEGNDQMQFNTREMVVAAQCTDIEVTFKHAGTLPAKVMGHDWVLAKAGDMSALVNAGMAAGFKNGYLPKDDPRIIAASKIIGGGESTTITFKSSALQEGMEYAFFCTAPGHATIMRGKFIFGGNKAVAGSPAGSRESPSETAH